MMDRAIAFVVGIEKYKSPDRAPSLPTAGPDALRIAARLQAMGVSAQNTFVFVAPAERSPADQVAFEQMVAAFPRETTIKPSCTYDTLEEFWRVRLPELSLRHPDGCLFLYWCGHGFTDVATRLPLLLCADWSERRQSNAVDRLDLLETLHSDDYRGLRSQIVLFDACANQVASSYQPRHAGSTWDESIDQISISSAARGQLAGSDETSSYFARLVLDVLSDVDGWPDLDDFSTRLEHAVKTAGQTSSRVYYRRGNGDEIAWYGPNVGRDSLVKQLMGLSIAPSDLRPLYLPVVSPLAVRDGRREAQTIPEMVDTLWNANGRANGSFAPYPVVEFALRVHSRFGDKATGLVGWLKQEFVAPADLAQARTRLSDERNALYLVVEIQESKSASRPGEIESFDARLLDYDHAGAVEPWPAAKHDVRSWSDLADKIRPVVNLAQLIAGQRKATLTIEFLTNVFDIDPHRIPLAIGEPDTIGEHNPVILRWRKPRTADTRPDWVTRAERIRQGSISTSVLAVSARDKLEECCVLFLRHVLPAGSRPPHPQRLTPGWDLVRRAVSSGAPFICWPLAEPQTGDLSEYERELAIWVTESRPIDRVPARVRHERVAGPIAADINVYWDDPLPTYQLRELRTR